MYNMYIHIERERSICISTAALRTNLLHLSGCDSIGILFSGVKFPNAPATPPKEIGPKDVGW